MTFRATPDARRAGLLALLVAAVVALAYRPADPVATPATVVAAPAAATAAPAHGFALDEAIALAGREIPDDVDSYSFFAYTDDDGPADREIAELSVRLREAAAAREFLGITGPDPERNRRNLLAALAANRGRDLHGLIILFLGPPEHRDAISAAARARGAELRYLIYPAAAATET